MTDQSPPPAPSVPSAPWVGIYDEPTPVQSPENTVYSTRPRVTAASNGREYFLKGPEREIVVAEAIGYQLAHAVGLPVPEWAFTRDPETDAVLFASAAARTRSAIDLLLRTRDAVNPELLADCRAVDLWIANNDRNMGSIVAEPLNRREGGHKLLAIDFEKAMILRGVDRFTVTATPPAQFTPRGKLNDFCVGHAYPGVMCIAIARVTAPQIRGMFSVVESAVGPVGWADSAADFLAKRALRIDQDLREVWDA